MKPTYYISSDRSFILCKLCGNKSYNFTDVDRRFCSQCGVYHVMLEERPNVWMRIQESWRALPKRWQWAIAIMFVTVTSLLVFDLVRKYIP